MIAYGVFFDRDSRLLGVMTVSGNLCQYRQRGHQVSTLLLFIGLLSIWYVRFPEQSSVAPQLTVPRSAESR
jgi:hypothetical protein